MVPSSDQNQAAKVTVPQEIRIRVLHEYLKLNILVLYHMI